MPFGKYKDFDDCVAKNQDKDDPRAYCASIQKKTEREKARENGGGEPTMRALMNLITSDTPRIAPDGTGVKILGVTLLTAGTWVDGGTGTPLHYGEDVLKQYANNWKTTGLWSVHTGGMPREITKKIGEIVNPRFENGALLGDLFFHLKTQESKDAFELVSAGLRRELPPVSFSVEHTGKEHFDPASRIYVADSLMFHGGAIVETGASAGTTILSAWSGAELSTTLTADAAALPPTITLRPKTEEGNSLDKELAEKIAGLEARVVALEGFRTELSAKKEEPKAEPPKDTPKADTNELEALKTQVKELAAAIETLTKQPPVVVREASAPVDRERILIPKVKKVDQNTIIGA